MRTPPKDMLLGLINDLVAEGNDILESYKSPQGKTGFSRSYARWKAQCRNLLRMLGPQGRHWRAALLLKGPSMWANARFMIGTLEGIGVAIEKDHLLTIEDLVMAEAFADLLEQAEYLLSEGYFLAAGVLGRAVLEEHLRKWCERRNCAPIKPAGKPPTLADYNQELYKATHISKLDMQQVTAMATVGNDAAHNKAGLTLAQVEWFVPQVRTFVTSHPLP